MSNQTEMKKQLKIKAEKQLEQMKHHMVEYFYYNKCADIEVDVDIENNTVTLADGREYKFFTSDEKIIKHRQAQHKLILAKMKEWSETKLVETEHSIKIFQICDDLCMIVYFIPKGTLVPLEFLEVVEKFIKINHSIPYSETSFRNLFGSEPNTIVMEAFLRSFCKSDHYDRKYVCSIDQVADKTVYYTDAILEM